MKKLLVLLMVLGLVSSAQAALSLSLSATSVAVGSDVTVSVISDDDIGWTWQFVMSEDTYNWSNPVAASFGAIAATTKAGDMFAITPDPGYLAVVQLSAGGSTVLPSAGTQFTVVIHGVQNGTIDIDLQDGGATSQIGGGLSLQVGVPEPMTMALLGLGGLFLRRRK